MAPTFPENDDEDGAIVEALRSGEDVEAAFRSLFVRYRKRLLGFFTNRGLDPETCADLSQETFVRVYRTRTRFRGDAPLAVWIFRIAANLYRNEIRRRQAAKRQGIELPLIDERDETTQDVDTGSATPGDAEPLAGTLRREQAEVLRQVIEEMPPQMRRVFQLRAYHGYSTRDIGIVLKIAPSTVKVHLHQARKRLAELLAARYAENPF